MTATPPFYSRAGLNVETYDERVAWFPGPTDGDVEFYVARARAAGGPVLEIASGTGRVTWALAAAGCEVVGLDLSDAMLAAAESKRRHHPDEVGRRVRFVKGDMVDFDLDQLYPVVLVPFRAFQSIVSPGDQRRALESMSDHLTPDGRLVVDLFDPRLEYCLPEGDRAPRFRATVRHPRTGHEVRVEVLERSNDPVSQVLEERWSFREVDRDGRTLRAEEEMLRLRWTYRYEMRYLIELAGLEVETEYSDFRGSPPTYGQEQIWVVRKP